MDIVPKEEVGEGRNGRLVEPVTVDVTEGLEAEVSKLDSGVSDKLIAINFAEPGTEACSGESDKWEETGESWGDVVLLILDREEVQMWEKSFLQKVYKQRQHNAR